MNHQSKTHNEHMAEVMYLHYDSIINSPYCSKPQKELAVINQEYWERMWITATMHTHPINELIRSVT